MKEKGALPVKGTAGRLIRTFLFHGIKIVSLLLAVSIIAFVLVSASPIDPVQQYILGLGTAISPEQRAEIEAYWGVNEPPVERYLSWLSELLRGNWGESALYRRPVADIIGERFANSLALMLCAWLLSGVIGFALGCVMGVFRDRWPDSILKKLCYLLSSVPTFWLGLLFLLIFSVWLGWFPIGFSAPIGVAQGSVTLGQRLHHLALPAITLSLMSFANIALHTRQKLIDVLNSEYVLFARARGEGTWTVLRRHGLRNVLLPAVTLQFASFAELFGGSVLAENVFSYPGLGSAVAAAGLNSDVPLLLGVTLFSALFVCVGNMIANLLYGLVDPQIREVGK
ncbi:MAG: ABC transporter permease [Oscillospiraceae bacterium]|nr:ABC transporter permease [Oscillospiraceae bacterium]